ncbi:HD domain-containing protein [Shinella zoogloeoides]
MDHKIISSLREFLRDAEGLKREVRHSYLSDGRMESVAEHVWRMALLGMMVAPFTRTKIHTERLLKLIIIHDLVEIYAGDVALTDHYNNAEIKAAKRQRETDAILKIRSVLPAVIGEEFYSLWEEYEARETPEAKLAHALDKIEAQAQHNEAGIGTWEKAEYHFAYDLPQHTMQEPVLEDLAKILIAEVDEMLATDPDSSVGAEGKAG